MSYITVPLTEAEKRRLRTLAEKELRHPRQQAAKLLREALDRAEQQTEQEGAGDDA